MSDLLTHTEYRALANSLDLPRSAHIDGRYSAGQGQELETLNPATGECLAMIAACDASDVDRAVSKARQAFDQGVWAHQHPGDRKAAMIRLCKLIRRNRRELAVMESLDSGKPVRDCELIDVPETLQTLLWHAEAADKIYDQVAPTGNDAMATIVREPVGVVAAILPWNFPLLMLAWKLGPALAAGNSVIIKPAEQTSLTALRICELAAEAGIPRGVVQVLPGDGPSVGEPLGRHPDVDMVSFTGSTETGRHFLRYAADSNLKKTVLECGGKNPAVVLADAEHLERVSEHLVNAAFWNMGENCSACSRLIVHRSIMDELLERMVARTREWRCGDPLDPANALGALIDRTHVDKIAGYLRDSNTGAPVVGGEIDGPYVTPTIFKDVAPQSALGREEIFGPILSVMPVDSTAEAIELANDTDYGLSASVFTANANAAMRTARAIRAGTVTINCYGEGDITTPFGGYRQSGFGGRDNGVHAHDQYTELKTIWLDLTDPADGEAI